MLGAGDKVLPRSKIQPPNYPAERGFSLNSGGPSKVAIKPQVALFLPFSPLSFPNGSGVKNPLALQDNAGDPGSIPGSGRYPGGGNGNPIQYSCLGNAMERSLTGTVQGVAKELATTERINNSSILSLGSFSELTSNISRWLSFTPENF